MLACSRGHPKLQLASQIRFLLIKIQALLWIFKKPYQFFHKRIVCVFYFTEDCLWGYNYTDTDKLSEMFLPE